MSCAMTSVSPSLAVGRLDMLMLRATPRMGSLAGCRASDSICLGARSISAASGLLPFIMGVPSATHGHALFLLNGALNLRGWGWGSRDSVLSRFIQSIF